MTSIIRASLLLYIVSFGLKAQANDGKRLSRSEYIDIWKDEAIYQMVVHKIPASITLAQGILESADGNSELARSANNHFGIKCHSDWTGKKAYHDDDKKGECFRHYPSANESFEDHSLFLKKNRYSPLFELKIDDYKAWAKGLKKCGYATNNQYAQLLIKIVEDNQLDKFDKLGMNHIKKGEIPGGKRENNPIAQESSKLSKKTKTKGKDLPSEIILGDGRSQQFSSNDIRFVKAKDGESIQSLAKTLDVMPWQIRKYNDLGSREKLIEGEVIYLQPKRNKSKEATSHVVLEGESLRSISQQYGVKISKILKRNGLEENAALVNGMTIRLR